MLEPAQIQCPYCWELLEISIDPSVPEQSYVEDCQVCCQPIVIDARLMEDGSVDVVARAEND